jgi:hypothetical protein
VDDKIVIDDNNTDAAHIEVIVEMPGRHTLAETYYMWQASLKQVPAMTAYSTWGSDDDHI